MRIEQLGYLLAIATKKSFSSASENLHLTPQSLSRSISCMENELGFKLFERNSQGVRFTEAGEMFLAAAQKIVSEYESALENIQGFLTENQQDVAIHGELVIYANPLFHIHWLPKILKKFCQENPYIRVTVLEKDPVGIYHRLEQAEKDNDAVDRLGIVLVPAQEQDAPARSFFGEMEGTNNIHFEYLSEEPYYVYVSKHSSLAKMRQISIKEVLKEPIVLFASDESNMTPVRFLLEQYGKPNVVFTASSLHLWLNAINNGVGIGLIQESILGNEVQLKLEDAQVMKLRLKEDINAVLGYLYWGEPTKVIRRFIRYFP